MEPSPPLSITTLSSTLTKRSRSRDSRHPSEKSKEDLETAQKNGPALKKNGVVRVPAFLKQSKAEIRQKFEELEWRQRLRIAEGNLSHDSGHRWALEEAPEVKSRNRYMNVQAWANSRIHLKVPEGQCDFINASPITLKDSISEEEFKYIATQGPKDGQFTHFWHMIWHETGEVAVIVMLTQTSESGREKCAQYFPLDVEDDTMAVGEGDPFMDGDSHSGNIKILESTFDEGSRSEVRKLLLTIGEESKTVWHLLFPAWQDYSKPAGEDRDALLKLLTLSAAKSASPSNPRIVHCSAGVGRTGTFIALDYLLRELESGALQETKDKVDVVFETVNNLREQRMMMVYNEMQLQFIYEVVKEQWESKQEQPSGPPSEGMNGVEERSPKVARLATDTSPDDAVGFATATASVTPPAEFLQKDELVLTDPEKAAASVPEVVELKPQE